jgi:hypothetical protein
LQGLIPTALTTRFNACSFAGNPLLRGTPLTGSQAIGHHHSSGSSTGAIVGRDVGGAGLLALIVLPSICGLRICVGWQRRGTTGAKAKAVACCHEHIHDRKPSPQKPPHATWSNSIFHLNRQRRNMS